MSRSFPPPRIFAVALLLLLTQTGCLQILQARARERRAQQEAAEKKVLEGFLSEHDTAIEQKRWEDAAASFTLEREKQLLRYGVWHGRMRKLWYTLERLADASAGKRDFGTAVQLCSVMDKVPAALPKGLREDIDRKRANHQHALDQRLQAWAQATTPAREDEAAGRKACAAARLSAAYGAPSVQVQQETDAKICALATEVAKPWLVKVFVEKGKVAGGPGQAELATAMEQAARDGTYGPAVQFAPDAASADVVVRFHLEAEKFDHAVTQESRSGRYVSGQKVVSNPDIPKLRKEIAYWDKETAWKHKAAASIRCSGRGPCKSRIAHQNDARKFAEKARNLRSKLASAKPSVKQPVYSEHSYGVKVHKWTLTQPITIEVSPRKGKKSKQTLPVTRFITGLEYDAQPKLGLGAAKPTPPAPDALRPPLHETMRKTSDYLVHNNLGARNDAIVAKVKATRDLEQAEWIATYIALNPNANADNIRFANDNLQKLLKVGGAGSALASKTRACWKK